MKRIQKDSKKVKGIKNYALKRNLYLFLDKIKFYDFPQKNAVSAGL